MAIHELQALRGMIVGEGFFKHQLVETPDGMHVRACVDAFERREVAAAAKV